jgi:hypothetical protein
MKVGVIVGSIESIGRRIGLFVNESRDNSI